MISKIDEWKKIILSINDNSFFDLMRNYLGRIETPFNKQDLINRLVFFFNRKQTKEIILEIIDSDDASLLTAIHLLNGPSDNQLQNIFSEWKYLELHNRIQNMEERFLIYRKEGFLYITPVFEELFIEKIISPSLLIQSKEADSSIDTPLWLNDSLMFALLSFIQKNSDLIKIDGSIKKRGITELETVFPSLFKGEEGLKRFEICASVFTNLNIINRKDGLLYANMKEWEKLASLSESVRFCIYYGAALAKNSNEISEFYLFIKKFLQEFPDGRAIQKSSIINYYKLYTTTGNEELPLFRLNEISERLILLNVLIEENEYLKINDLINFQANRIHNEPVLVIQPNFEITIKPFINIQNCLDLASALDIKKFDLFSLFSLTRESFLRAFDKGIKSSRILDKLKAMSGKEIPQNIIISLKDWEDDHKKVKLYSGIVLKVSEDKQMLIENTDFLKPYIKETLAPGIYLLDQSQEKLWLEALGELSISPLPTLKEADDEDNNEDNSNKSTELITVADEFLTYTKKKWPHQEKSQNELIKAHVTGLLNKLNKSGIAGDEKKEIEARIKRRLIIMESQINRGIIRPEVTEAKGINFQGKIRLIESAMTNNSDRLELTFYSGSGSETFLVNPVELLKEGNEKTLIGKILPDEEQIKINVSKISKLKKIRSSLF